MSDLSVNLDFSAAVAYHPNQFPPKIADYSSLMIPLSRAAAALARYTQMPKGMHSRGLLLAPLRNQEAVISSRMEGTVSTLDEVLRYEADHDDAEEAYSGKYRTEAIEVPLYGPALKMAQASVTEGLPLSSWSPRSAHQVLLGFARGAHMAR